MNLPNWIDGPEGGTPLSAANLRELNDAILERLKRWQPSTAYAMGEQVVSPDNDVVSAALAHTSGPVYNPANWGRSVTFEPALPPDGTATKFLRGDREWVTLDLSGAGESTSTHEQEDMEVLILASNASAPVGSKLTVPTHLSPGGGQTTHPSVLFFPDSWNGYKYWMAHTPYPAGNDDHEDPNICASDDGSTWVVPAGLTNPIDDADGTPEYNSDVDLKMGPNNTMYLFWRWYAGAGNGGTEERLKYSTSTDGVNWSAPVVFYQSDHLVQRLVSPSLIFEDNAWTMYAVDTIPSPNRVVRLRSNTADPESPWTDAVTISVGAMQAGKEPWHIYMLKYGGRYYGLLNDATTDSNGGGGDILLVISADGVTFGNSTVPVIPKVQAGEHDQLYRSTMVPAVEGGRFGFRVWYTGWLTGPPSVWNIYRTFLGEGIWKQLVLEGAWLTYTGGGGYRPGIRYKKVGNTVTLEGAVRSGAAASNLTTLPVGAAPVGTFMAPVNVAGVLGQIQIFADTGAAPADDRKVRFFQGAGAPSYLPFHIKYEVV